MPDGESFVLGSTCEVLQGLGAIESDIYMQGDKIKKILEKHPEMTLDEIKKIPRILNDPSIILSSKNAGNSSNSRLVLFGNVKAENGEPVLVVLDLLPVENRLLLNDMQKVVSSYTRNNTVNFIKTSDILYADKKKAVNLLSAIDLHILGLSPAIKTAFVGSISYSGEKVNINGKSFSEVFSGDEQEQQRAQSFTDREILELAANDLKIDNMTDGEKNALQIFKNRLSQLQDLQQQRQEQGRLYKEQMFGKGTVDRAAAAQTRNRMSVLDNQIKTVESEVLSVENKDILKQVLHKARGVVEAQERAHGQELLKRWRDRRNNAADIKKYRDRITQDVSDLTKWIVHPSNKTTMQRVPDALKKQPRNTTTSKTSEKTGV